MARLIYCALLALALAGAGSAIGKPDKPHAGKCHRTKYRYIGKERVPWNHDVDDHEWDEFDHSVEECEPPPC